MDKRPACGPYITRQMRRRAERELPPDQRPPKNRLSVFMAAVKAMTPGRRTHVEGYRGGDPMLFEVSRVGSVRKGGRVVASFRHPTKRATPGRMAFVTVTS